MTSAATRSGTTRVAVSDQTHSPKDLLRLGRLARELRLTDQILSDDLDTVSVVDEGPAPAWTSLDGDQVTFSVRHMPMPTDRLSVAVWLGTNAHELGHVLFSPRRHSTLMRRVMESDKFFMEGLHQLWNAVEDQRQERLLLARFAPWHGYLTAALGHHLTADNESAWLLMAGRTWLSQRVRDEAEARFVAVRGQAIADEVAGLIGDFQRLMDPGESDQEEAWDVLKRLHDIFADHPPKMPQPCTVMDGGEPDLQGRGTPPPAADEVPPPPDMGDETDDDGGDDDDDGAAAGDGDDDDRDDADGQDADQGGPSGTGAGDGPGSPQQSDLNKQLTDDADRQLNADETAKDLDDVMDALDHGRAGDADGDPSAGSNRDATDAARLLHREVSDALLDLKDEAEPGWVRRTDSGRLNPRRLLGSQINADELFDRYEPGQHDAADMEVAVLLDVSSSMASRKLALAESTWAIRQAVEDLEGTATVITWSYGHCTLAAAGDRPDGRMFVPEIVGGTNPTDALSDAFQILAGSDARIRLMVVLTDGDWEQSTKAEETIAAMREVGITTVLAFLPYQGATPKEPDAHGCEIAETIAQPQGLALLFRKVAAVRIQQW